MPTTHDNAANPPAYHRRAADPEQRRSIHPFGFLSGGPASSRASAAAMDGVIAASMIRIIGFSKPAGYPKKVPGAATPANPIARNTAGPAIRTIRSQRRLIGGVSVIPAIIVRIHMAARIVPP